jgi:hypothetical protein
MLLSSQSTASAADAEVVLHGNFLDRAIEDTVTEKLMSAHPELYWGDDGNSRVELSKSEGSNQIAVHLNMMYSLAPKGIDLPDPNVTVDFLLAFNCHYSDPKIELWAGDFDVETEFPWYVDVLTGGVSLVITEAANVVIGNSEELRSGLSDKVGSGIGDQLAGVPFDYCPVIEVTSDSDLKLTFGAGDECRSGAVSDQPCPRNTRGNGIHKICVNGRWEQTSWCERLPPPGGQIP